MGAPKRTLRQRLMEKLETAAETSEIMLQQASPGTNRCSLRNI